MPTVARWPCRCGVRLRRYYDWIGRRTIYQHGENPEHVLIVPDMVAREDPAESAMRRLLEWCERLHAYKGGGRPVGAGLIEEGG